MEELGAAPQKAELRAPSRAQQPTYPWTAKQQPKPGLLHLAVAGAADFGPDDEEEKKLSWSDVNMCGHGVFGEHKE